jgi:hypothetical protein
MSVWCRAYSTPAGQNRAVRGPQLRCSERGGANERELTRMDDEKLASGLVGVAQ